MTTQPTLPILPDVGAVLMGERAALLESASGGKFFINGQLAYVWTAGQDGLHRLAASQLVDTGAAQVNGVAAAFGVNTESLPRWGKSLEDTGLMGLAPVKKGPKRPSLLTYGSQSSRNTGCSCWWCEPAGHRRSDRGFHRYGPARHGHYGRNPGN